MIEEGQLSSTLIRDEPNTTESRIARDCVSRWSSDIQSYTRLGLPDHDQTVAPASSRLLSRFFKVIQEHRRLCFMIALLFTVCISTVVLTYLIIIPKIVRSILAKNNFSIDALRFSDVSDQGFRISLRQSLGKVPLRPRISAFDAAIKGSDGSTLFYLPIPEFRGSSLNLSQVKITVLSQQKFADFAKQLITSAQVSVVLQGQTFVTVLGKAVFVKLSKALIIRGLIDADVKILDVKGNRTHIESSVRITYEQSQVAVDFGSCTFELLYHGVQLAKLESPVLLQPRIPNVLEAKGDVVLSPLLGQPKELGPIFANVLSGRPLGVSIHGLQCAESQWATAAIASFNKTTKLTDRALITALGSVIGV